VRLLASGKVREVYEVDAEHVLLVASDRISAYDVVLATPIPDKGRILTALTAWWLEQLADLVPHHLVRVDGARMLCRRLDMLPVECVARGYLAGSGAKDYAATGTICGIPLPPGLREGDRLPAPIFTPATKAQRGEHDENVDYAEVEARVGAKVAAALRDTTLAVYRRAAAIAEERGIIVADTKLEFGFDRAGVLTLGDEVLTPDSSRFWSREEWAPGWAQPSHDKQFVRDWLVERGLAGTPVELPPDVVARTRAQYVEAYERLTGRSFP
jgi:phosphoribosylaminoimidazole-succinocarboxamide synthase